MQIHDLGGVISSLFALCHRLQTWVGPLPEGLSPYRRRRGWFLGVVLFPCWISYWVVTVSLLFGWWCTTICWFRYGPILIFVLSGFNGFQAQLASSASIRGQGLFFVSSPRNSDVVFYGHGLLILAFTVMVVLVTVVFVYVFVWFWEVENECVLGLAYVTLFDNLLSGYYWIQDLGSKVLFISTWICWMQPVIWIQQVFVLSSDVVRKGWMRKCSVLTVTNPYIFKSVSH